MMSAQMLLHHDPAKAMLGRYVRDGPGSSIHLCHITLSAPVSAHWRRPPQIVCVHHYLRAVRRRPEAGQIRVGRNYYREDGIGALSQSTAEMGSSLFTPPYEPRGDSTQSDACSRFQKLPAPPLVDVMPRIRGMPPAARKLLTPPPTGTVRVPLPFDPGGHEEDVLADRATSGRGESGHITQRIALPLLR